jgi:hypothetical protein
MNNTTQAAQAAFNAVMQDAPQSPSEPTPIATPANETEELQREIDALAAMPLLKYERAYQNHAKLLGIRAAVLDKLVQAVRSGASEEGVAMFPEVVPWPSIVDARCCLSCQKASGVMPCCLLMQMMRWHCGVLSLGFARRRILRHYWLSVALKKGAENPQC